MISPRKTLTRQTALDETRRAVPSATSAAACPPVILLLVCCALCGSTRADQIVTEKENYRAARIVGFEGGAVRIRTSDGRLRSEWIDDIQLLLVERGGIFDDFNQAERFLADGQPVRAIVRYRRTLRLGQDFWPDLIAARLLRACADADQLDTAVLNWIRLLHGDWGGPEAAARLLPGNISQQRDRRTLKAIEQLESARTRGRNGASDILVELLRFEILRRINDSRAEPTACRAAAVQIPTEARSPEIYQILFNALNMCLNTEVQPEAMTALDHAIGNCPEHILPDFLLLKGRVLIRQAKTRQEWTRAAWPLLRIPIHFAHDPRAADGLYEAARALDRLGRPDKALQLLAECLEHKQVTEVTRKLALEAQLRLESGASLKEN